MAKKCLIVGSGLMVPCLVSTLQQLDFEVSVAGNIEIELQNLSELFDIPTFTVDATQPKRLIPLISTQSIVVSMVPAKFHHYVLKACIECKVNMITPSYVSKDMLELESFAIDAGILVLNEIGLDPGIDHMSVIKKLQGVKSLGGRVLEFQSSCGAFPAPEACDNLLQYKLAWAPYGALFAAVRPARYIQDGEIIDIAGKDIMSSAKLYDLQSEIPLNYYPNGDSLKYPEKYGIQEAKTVMRCSLRYENYPVICKGLQALGIYDETPKDFPTSLTWKSLTTDLAADKTTEPNTDSIESIISKTLTSKLPDLSPCWINLITSAFDQLGMLSSSTVHGQNIFDAFVNLVQKKLEYNPGERDCVVMEHKFLVQLNDTKVLYKSRLVEYGVPNGGTSAVSKLVSVPAALAADWVCSNSHAPGFMYPMELDFCNDILKRLETEYNIKFEELEDIISE
jgi:saccharopine dehydrogenase (NADP+, L-glutamate forming)